MENLEKLNFALARIREVKGNLMGKRDRIKYYTESLKDSVKWDRISIDDLERFNFEKEVRNRQIVISEFKKSKNLAKTV